MGKWIEIVYKSSVFQLLQSLYCGILTYTIWINTYLQNNVDQFELYTKNHLPSEKNKFTQVIELGDNRLPPQNGQLTHAYVHVRQRS